ncbi:hypothetical protein Taro_054622 [Colocasia esculenta]|uniref:Uncharacterized protein n=1 Tax=Colocasia esculenta TaxID=4460 RepID=A0A843XP10_COLES|nr:hypothetical protein [Colocasia esculenta]
MKLCGNKVVDIADLEKYGMHNIVAAMDRMKWTEITTFSEDGRGWILDFVCKGTPIRITYDLLKSLFGVCTTSHSGVHTVDTPAKRLGIIGPEFKLKDGKLDINQMNAFNHLLHFIVCQILVLRSATFSTCTKADSDMMFRAIQNRKINMAEVILERMRFAHAQIWDTKSKLNVSLPYAHLLTKIFKHFGINLSGAVVEKMGQKIRSRNLWKRGFSVVNGVWTKTFVAECEAIVGEAQCWVECVLELPKVVDTRSKQVDTSPRFQKGRSTLDPVSSRTVLQKWDSKSTLDQGRSTHSG